ncbi:TadA family conjugal transfer-associated ATPase [uncultured Agrococcus sp.]|uniref:TadA family conjugal transfer-associated ATPase n=1 Tax=uncultured Agrococcus sp. TaxID=382258 RepID=UPI0025FB9F13|nr:TadA family conjugal transfer-associated ATPase [uncultured Agrococcus sp.]
MSNTVPVPFVPGLRVSAPGRPGMAGEFGELLPFVSDATVTDVFAAANGVWVDRGRGAELQALRMSEARVRTLAVRLIAAGGRHVDEATPCVDVRIGDGIRVHAVLQPVAVAGTQLSIRLPAGAALDLAALDSGGTFRHVGLPAIRRLVDERVNTLITGAGGSGKTTLLAAMLGAVPAAERIITIEDVAELRIRHPHVVAMQSRQANLEGAGEVTLERLVREALRMRPDRLVLGECRGPEVREMLMALNTGHDGGAGTLHANSLDDVAARLEALGALAGLSQEAMGRQVVSAIGAVVHVERREGWRGIVALGRVVMRDGQLAVERQ